MRPAPIAYQRPATLADALDLLSQHSDAKLLAGGHSLIPSMNLRLAQPDMLIDIGRLEALKGISVSGTALLIGAATPHAQIAASPSVRAHARALGQACGIVGDPQVRNWGTLGGNLAHADPASDPPTAVLAAGGKLHLRSAAGERVVPASDFFLDLFTTALQPGEIMTHVELPIVVDRRSAYVKLPHPASRYAVVGIAAVLDVGNGVCTRASVAIGGATTRAMRSPGAEAALIGTTLDAAALDAAAAALMAEVAPNATSDAYAPAAYRTAMAGVFLKRAVRAALA